SLPRDQPPRRYP
ncbi:hypothetical protein BN1708_018675, partial [Verticillium longisporum]